jgi:hypothetical protein
MSAVPFKGTFDGDGHAISNLRLSRTNTSRLGLFGYVADPNAQIRHLRLTDPNVQGADYVGALVGTLVGGTVTDCHIEAGSVHGNTNVGGLVGSGGRIVRCSVQEVEVVAGKFWASAGGLAATAAEIVDCRVTGGLVRGNSNVGGLAAYMTGGTISGCCTATRVEAAQEGLSLGLAIGGLVGNNSGTIENSYSTSSVTQGNAANLIAFFPSGAGGLVGYNRGTIRLSYSAGVVVASTGGGFFGMPFTVEGLAGLGWGGVIDRSFWDMETSGQATSAGGMGKTTAEMQTASTFLDAGWDFIDETANGTEDIWWIDEGKDYPRLRWEIPAE